MSTDDTMRRIEEALDQAKAEIRAALQPDAGGWGEDDDRHRANEQAANLEEWNSVDHGELAQSRTEPVRPYSDVRAELLKPHEFTGRHRSYQDLLDEEHERAVEAWLDRVHYVNGNYLVFGSDIDEALRLMRWQPKETTDGK